MNPYLQPIGYKAIPCDHYYSKLQITFNVNRFYFFQGWKNLFLTFKVYKLHFKKDLVIPDRFWNSLNLNWERMDNYYSDPIPF